MGFKNLIIRSLTGFYVNALAELSDGSLVQASFQDIIIWNPSTGQIINKLVGHTDWLRAVVLMTDGRLASSCQDKTIRIWNTTTGQTIRILHEVNSGVWSLALLQDGTLASGLDSVLKIWDTTAGI